MNYFFSFRNSFLKSKLTIPRFQNNGIISQELNVYEALIENDTWKINLIDCDYNNNFYFIDEKLTNNYSIYFLARDKDLQLIKKVSFKNLVNFNNFTTTLPVEYRSNFKIFTNQGGFSSYQSDYPFDMTCKNGSILSPINTLLNVDSDYNSIIFRNIYTKPINKEFNLFFVNLFSKKVLFKKKLLTNFTNEIVVEKKFIDPDVYIFTDNFIGIPVYLSIKKGHLSLEHTHPPHHYILSEDKFDKIKKIKTKVYEIISSNNT